MSDNLRPTSTRNVAMSSTSMSRPTREAQPVFLFHSGKGGVAKSTEALKLNYHLIKIGKTPALIDADGTVQDLILAHHEEQECHPIELSNEDGFTEMADVISTADPAAPIIASCAGGQAEIFNEYVPVLMIAARDAGRKVNLVSPLDLHVNSYAHLPQVEKVMPEAEIFVVRPRWFGRPAQFRAFNASQIGQRYLAADRVIDVPLMPAALARAFKDGEHSLRWVELNGSGGERASLEAWRERSRSAYARFLG